MEQFDDQTGEPQSWLPKLGDTQVGMWVRRWLVEQWHEWAPRTRTSAVESLSRFVPLAVGSDAPDPPSGLRLHLIATLEPDHDSSGDSECSRWLDPWCVRLTQVDRPLLAEVDRRLGIGDDDQPLAPLTAAR